MENGILIELLNSLHKLFGLPSIQGTIDPDHLDCIKKCSKVTHFYKTECLAKCGISPQHLAKIYNSVPNSTNININFHKIPNSTTLLNPHEIPNSTTLDQFANNNSIPRVIELFHNLTNPDLELQQKLIRRLFDGGTKEDKSPSLEYMDVKYLYLFLFMAITPILVLFYTL